MPMPRTGHRLEAKRWEQAIPACLVIEPDNDHEMRKDVTLPFLPRRGDQIGVGPDGDYMGVTDVFWHPEDGVSVWFDDERYTAAHLLADGWIDWPDYQKRKRLEAFFDTAAKPRVPTYPNTPVKYKYLIDGVEHECHHAMVDKDPRS